MKVSINEQESCGEAKAQTKYFLQGTAQECYLLLELLETQAADRLALSEGNIIDLPAIRLGETDAKAAGCREGDTPITLDPAQVMSIKHGRLLEAVRAVYYAAWWKPDRAVDEKKLWTELRDAAGFTQGVATDSLGLNGHDLKAGISPGLGDSAEPPLFYQLRSFLSTVIDDGNGNGWADAHFASKMFMALWRRSCKPGALVSQNDQYHIECYDKRVEQRKFLAERRKVMDKTRAVREEITRNS